MQEQDLKKVIEALLFVSEKPLIFKQITEVLEGIEITEIHSAIDSLKNDYNKPEHGIQVAEVAGGYQFCTNPDCAEFLKKLYKTRRVCRLSAPALETLAIIAYKQPITRSEIEYIRGVNVDGVIKTLLERMLIKVKGRKEVPGRPLMYGTSDEFLQYFGLKTLQELPSLDEFAVLEDRASELSELRQSEEASNENKEGNNVIAAAPAALPVDDNSQDGDISQRGQLKVEDNSQTF